MKSNIIKFSIIKALLIMSLLSCYGCRESGHNSESAGVNTGGQLQLIPQASLKFYFPGQAKQDTRKVLDEVEKRLKQTLNIKLDFCFVPWEDYINKIKVLTAIGDRYDAHYDTDWMSFGELSQKGMLLNIKDLFVKYAPNLYKKYSPDELAAATVDGQLLAIPWHFPKSERRTFQVRADLAKRYINKDIKTLEDIEEFFKIINIKEKEPGIVPLDVEPNKFGCFDNAEMFGYVPLDLNQNLVYGWDDPEMRIIPWEQTPEFKHEVERWHRWYTKGYIPANVLTAGGCADETILAGKYASRIHIFESNELLSQKLKDINAAWEGSVVYNLYPERVAHIASPINNALCINKFSGDPDRVMMFLEWVAAKQENFDLVIYGIKDLHYELEGDAVKFPGDITSYNSPYYGWSGQWVFWNMDLYRRTVKDPSGYKKQLSESAQLNTKSLPHLGFSYTQNNIKSELANRRSVYESIGRALMYGLYGSDRIDEYVEKQKQAGTEKIISDIQSQLDRWKSGRK